MTTFTGTSVNILERRARDGDTVVDSVLAATEPDTPICAGISGLTFRHCRFKRTAAPRDAELTDCPSIQTPRPPSVAPEAIYNVGRTGLVEIVEAARDGRRIDVSGFCTRLDLNLSGLEGIAP